MADCAEVLDHLKYTYQPFLNYPPHPFFDRNVSHVESGKMVGQKNWGRSKKRGMQLRLLIDALLCLQNPHSRQRVKRLTG